MTFSQRKLTAYKLASRTEISRELYEDATDMAARELARAMARKMSAQIDYYGIQGTGSAQPLGIINEPTIDTTGSVGAIAWEDIAAAVLAVRQNNHSATAAIMNPEVYHDLTLLLTGDGSSSEKGWLLPSKTVEDKALHATTNCPLANVIVADFSRFVIGIRNGVRVEMTMTGGDAFADHQVWLKCFSRVAFGWFDLNAAHLLSGVTS